MTVTGYTQAFSGYYNSQDFDCTGADCRYNSFAEGDSA